MQSNTSLQLAIVALFTALMMIIPWEELQGWKFVDRLNYLNYFLHEKNVLEYKNFDRVWDFVFGEVLWHYSIRYLIYELNISIQTIFLFISGFSIATFSLFLTRKHNAVYLLLLINPLFVSLVISQLRIALAFSLLLVAYMNRKKVLVILLTIAAIFIHTATILFIGIYIVVMWSKKILNEEGGGKATVYGLLFFVGIILSVILGPLLSEVLSYFGDRRAVTYTGDASSSLLYTSYWAGLLVLYAFQDSSFYKDDVNLYCIVILSLVSFNLVTGGYTSRFIAVSLPMIFSSVLCMKGNAKVVSLVLYIIYVSFQWIYWLPVQVI